MNALHNNPYEAAARASKLARLLDAADALATEGGLHPRLHAALILDAWRNATVLHFAELVKRAKVRPPSAVTLQEFFAALEHRANARAS